ncbi:hypothetical protein F5H01DRAFT_343725 [Linnemannia elongata]|nr:hypothetical protein F5H01DRAFT_343725 [Linnemannia elongata]
MCLSDGCVGIFAITLITVLLLCLFVCLCSASLFIFFLYLSGVAPLLCLSISTPIPHSNPHPERL